MSLELSFRNIFLASVLAKCVCNESGRKGSPPTSAKRLLHVAQTDFCVHR